jgi:small subunit ribosomal protein S13
MSSEKKPVSEVKRVQKGPILQKGPIAPVYKEKKIIRIAEADLDGSQRIEHALSHIKGISWSYAHAIRNVLGFQNKKLEDLSEEEINKIKSVMMNPEKHNVPTWLLNRQKDIITGKNLHLLSSDLILSNKLDVKLLKTIRTYRGIRHSFNYKVRGQRTRSKGANVRGRVGGTVGVVRRKMLPGAGKKDEKK